MIEPRALRPYRESDEGQVVALWRECGLVRSWNDPHKDIARKLQVQRELFLVVAEAGRVLATIMAGYDGHRGWVYYLAVAPSHRGQGIATGLVRHVEQALQERGCPKLSLLVRGTNAAVLAFYGKLGYAQDASVPLGRRLIADE
jgi:ribosomal protein S18 acetylase RimI-like enzyme